MPKKQKGWPKQQQQQQEQEEEVILTLFILFEREDGSFQALGRVDGKAAGSLLNTTVSYQITEMTRVNLENYLPDHHCYCSHSSFYLPCLFFVCDFTS